VRKPRRTIIRQPGPLALAGDAARRASHALELLGLLGPGLLPSRRLAAPRRGLTALGRSMGKPPPINYRQNELWPPDAVYLLKTPFGGDAWWATRVGIAGGRLQGGDCKRILGVPGCAWRCARLELRPNNYCISNEPREKTPRQRFQIYSATKC
jgi:hypothetical protein